jgi:hypothetical protein
LHKKNKEIQQRYTKKAKSQKKSLGRILGLEPLEEKEGSSAYFAHKDLEEDKSQYGVRFLLPNLYSNYGKNKEQFEDLKVTISNEIKKNERFIRKMEPVWSRQEET